VGLSYRLARAPGVLPALAGAFCWVERLDPSTNEYAIQTIM
jgi:hypothetical protein